ncbi:hypothetical protein HMI56_001487 [Coelomomyces lativittatus]|nr:hypothetical protein HMI56_001487 [Coelomomyces lativittatus]
MKDRTIKAFYHEGSNLITSSLLRPTCFRRYSDFDTLDRRLHQDFPQLRWHPLPPKTWKKPSLRVIYFRQSELAKYLTSILNIPEVKEAKYVVEFLNLPAALTFVTTESWFDRYREVHQALMRLKNHLNQCDQSTLQGMRSFRRIQTQIQQEWARVAVLEKELDDLTITPMEKARRLNLLTNLQNEFQMSCSTTLPAMTPILMASKPTSPKKPPTVIEQHRFMESQDQVASDLIQVIQRQKQVALQMNESLLEQTSILEELRTDFDGTGKKMEGASKQTKPFT